MRVPISAGIAVEETDDVVARPVAAANHPQHRAVPMSPAPAISTRTCRPETATSGPRAHRAAASGRRPSTTMVVPQSSKNTLRGMAGSGLRRYWIIAIVTRPPVAASQQDHQVVEGDRAAPSPANPQAHEPDQLRQHDPARGGAETVQFVGCPIDLRIAAKSSGSRCRQTPARAPSAASRWRCCRQ